MVYWVYITTKEIYIVYIYHYVYTFYSIFRPIGIG